MLNNTIVRDLTKFPFELVIKIVNYTGVLAYRNGKFIDAIPKSDPRYEMLKNIVKPYIHVFGPRNLYATINIEFSNRNLMMQYSIRPKIHGFMFQTRVNRQKNIFLYKRDANGVWHKTFTYSM